MSHTHTSSHVVVHAWAETDVLGTVEHPEMTGMPRHGDMCCLPGCYETLVAGERAVAVIEVERADRIEAERGEAWVGYEHPLHRTWKDGQ